MARTPTLVPFTAKPVPLDTLDDDENALIDAYRELTPIQQETYAREMKRDARRNIERRITNATKVGA